MLFCRFLAQSRGGKPIWECDAADLRAYKRVRLHTPGPAQVSVATWRRSIAALDKWAAWALYEGLAAALASISGDDGPVRTCDPDFRQKVLSYPRQADSPMAAAIARLQHSPPLWSAAVRGCRPDAGPIAREAARLQGLDQAAL